MCCQLLYSDCKVLLQRRSAQDIFVPTSKDRPTSTTQHHISGSNPTTPKQQVMPDLAMITPRTPFATTPLRIVCIFRYPDDRINVPQVQSRASFPLCSGLSSGCYANRCLRGAGLFDLVPANATKRGSRSDCPVCCLRDHECTFVWACRPAPDSSACLAPLDPPADLS